MSNNHRLAERQFYEVSDGTIVKVSLPDDCPVVIFNCNPGYTIPDTIHRTPALVTGASRELAAVLIHDRIALPIFMHTALCDGGILPYEDDIAGRPLIFFLTLYDIQFEATRIEIQTIRSRYPNAKICLGGPSVNTAKNLSQLATFFPEADIIAKGDGEAMLRDIIDIALNPPSDIRLASLRGMYIKRHNQPPWWNNDAAKLTNPEYQLKPMTISYPELIEQIIENQSLRLMTSRGCAYRCVFCQNHRDDLLAWTPERIIQELHCIRTLIEAGYLPPEAKTIDFNDDDFFLDKERAKQFLKEVLADPDINGYFTFEMMTGIGSFYDYYDNYVVISNAEKAGDVNDCYLAIDKLRNANKGQIAICFDPKEYSDTDPQISVFLTELHRRFPDLITRLQVVTNYVRYRKQIARIDQELIDLLRRTNKSIGLDIGTDGFSDRMIKLLNKHGYNTQMILQVTDILNLAEVYNCHFIIYTHPALTKYELIEHFIEIHNLLIVYGYDYYVHSNVHLTVFDNTPLARSSHVRYQRTDKDVVRAGNAVKALPFMADLRDPELLAELKPLLMDNLPALETYSCYHNVGAPRQADLRKIYDENIVVNGRRLTVYGALISPILIFKLIALHYVIKELMDSETKAVSGCN